MKRFGSHDGHAVKICLNFFKIELITADLKGLNITNLRALDMGLTCNLVSEENRAQWISKNYEKETTAFIADSFSDIPSLAMVKKSFAPSNAHPAFKARVDFVLQAESGCGAVAEALDILLWENYNLHLWEYEFTSR